MRRLAIACLAVSTAMTAATSAFAQEAEAPTEEIIVTGSRAAQRTSTDSPVAIDVISGESLKSSGATETNRVLNQLVPSFNFPQPSLTDGTDSLRPATLRGLSPDQVLVLVNGKRRHSAALLNLNGSVGRGSSAVDLNQLPPIAIERIEVLRDGAASQYGSDAIAGVINLQLSRATGVRGSVTYGKYITTMDGVRDYDGVLTGPNGLPQVVTAGGGTNDILALNFTDERDRNDGDTVTIATNIGVPVGPGGYLNVTAQFRDRDRTQRSGADPRRQYPTIGDPRELTFDRFNHGFGDGQAEDFNFVVNTGYELGAFELYAFGTYGIRDGTGAGFFRRPNDARNRDFAASTTSFVPFYPDGFLPLIASEIEDVSGAIGIRGDVGGFKADLSVIYGSDELNYRVENSFNTSLGGLVSPRAFDAGGLAAGQTVINLDLSRTLDTDLFERFGIALGAEYRNENFKIRQGELASYVNGPFVANGAAGGAQVFPGFQPTNAVDATRDSWAVYAEADFDPITDLTFQLAARYENYSDFGDTFNLKAAGRWEVVPGVAIRGSASTGFRAPSLSQQFFTATSTNNVQGLGLIEVGTFPVASPVARALGAQPLDAEKSLNLGGGLVLDPFTGFTLTVDYYNIRIRDRVTLTENLTGAAVVALLQSAGINNVTSARFFVNGVDTRTQGIDVVATYRLPEFGLGDFRLTAGYNYNDTKIIDRAVLPSLPGLLLFGRVESFRLTDGQPTNKLNLSLDWSLGPVNAVIRANRFGEVFTAGAGAITVGKGDAPADFTLTPKWLTDLQVTLKVHEGLRFTVGADNVFDVYPDRLPERAPFTANSFFLPYSSLSPFGFNGRFLYSRLDFEF